MDKFNEIVLLFDKLKFSLSKQNFTIDINDPDWMEKAKEASRLNPEQIKVISYLRQYILHFVHTSEKDLQDKLRKIILSNLNVADRIFYTIEELKFIKGKKGISYIRDALELIAYLGFVSDARDTVLYLKEIIILAKKEKIDYKSMIMNALPFVCLDVCGNFGSMKKIMEDVVYYNYLT